ncbi:MAG: enoyl-CoA hydratase-related protein [Proteobacteria bacterium]|nr:enoyl-CoA hydratase-related protein [Pseudomonadota bacterium]
MPTTDQPVLCDIDGRGVATLTLNRPDVNNAYDGDMIEALLQGAGALGADPKVRAVVLRGNGKHFQAGADLAWLDRVRSGTPEENLAVSRRTTDAVRFLDALPKPTVALVHGACFGGGTGIIAACDVVIAADNAVFSIAEVRWGLHAGPIIPALAAAIGPRQVRRYAITAERFDAMTAERLGLVHAVCPLDQLASKGAEIVDAILMNGPGAIAETKRILFEASDLGIDDAKASKLALDHARQRQTDEAAEGLRSFKEKRNARWYPGA